MQSRSPNVSQTVKKRKKIPVINQVLSDTMKKNAIRERVFEFIKQETGVANIDLKTELMRDLKLDGDDAQEFMSKFADHFSVDLSDFEFRRYFGPEAGFNPFVYLYLLLFKPKSSTLKSLTVADLLRAANQGQWIE